MSSFYSVIQFVSNQWYRENITIGLLAVSKGHIFFKIANRKLQLAKSLAPEAQKLLKLSTKQLESFVANEKKTADNGIHTRLPLEKPILLDEMFVERWHRYSNGVLQISSPEFIQKTFDETSFLEYFYKLVDRPRENLQKGKAEASTFSAKIKQGLYDPLRGKVDVDYSLKKGSLPSLYFDFHLENIGVNGVITASASLDLNYNRIDALQKQLAEYETVVDRLELFAKQRSISSDHIFYLIADHYKGSSPSNMELDALLGKGIEGKFERVSTSELSKIVKDVVKSNASKFSALLEK